MLKMMTDEEILREIKKYFSIEELVSPRVFKKYGQKAWQFMCIRLLHTILIVRVGTGRKITANNWKWGGIFKQRGLRSNLGYVFLGKIRKGLMYLSGHVLGKAIDFDVEGMTPNEVRKWIVDNQNLFPYKIRLERKFKGKFINWTHLDVIYNNSNPKVYLFDA